MAKLAKGTKVGVTISASPVYFTEIMGAITGVDPTVTTHDTTAHDTVGNVKTSIPGLVDNGKISFEMFFQDEDLKIVTKALGYVNSRLGGGLTDTFTLFYPDGYKETFTGYVDSLQRTQPLDAPQTIKVSIVVAGAVTATS